MIGGKHGALAGLLLLVGATAPLGAQNLFTNGGFESGMSGWTVGGLRGWTVDSRFAGDAITTGSWAGSTRVRSGERAVSGTFRGQPIESFTLSQTVMLMPGQSYSVGFWMALSGVDLIGMNSYSPLQIFVNGVGLLAENYFVLEETVGFREFAGSFVASGASNEITMQFVGSGTGAAPVSVDDAFLLGRAPDPTAVPEPGTVVLMGTGLVGLAAIARRRRSRHA